MARNQMFKIQVLIFLAILLSLTGCAGNPAAGTSSTQMAEPSAPEPQAATATPFLSTAAAPAQQTPIVIAQPTAPIPTELAEDFNDQKFPASQIIIYIPGPNSRISSPLVVSAYAVPGDQGKITLQLWGEDGRLIIDQLTKLKPTTGWVAFASKFPFEINSGGESTELTITSFDSDGRKVAVSGVPLILMQVGDSETEPSGFAKQPFVISNPPANTPVKGGILHLKGYAHPASSAPLVVELIKSNGGIVASKQITLKTAASEEGYVAFSTDLAYTVEKETPVRLSIRQMNDKTPLVDVALSSQLNTLLP